jgi:protein-S-isoprenylcysteine O-methyltransferase Ste14
MAMKYHLLDFRPPRIAMLLILIAGLTHWSLSLDSPGPLGARMFAPVPALVGFAIMITAWWQFRQSGIAICPTARTEGLITNGVYKYTRNPMYLGMVMMMCGVALFFGSYPYYLAAATLFAILNWVFCPYEESKLRATFGERYVSYMDAARRWI